MGNAPSTPAPVIRRLTYDEKICKIIAKYGFVKVDSPYDTICAFYYDASNKFMWLAQNIGNDIPLFTKPVAEVMLEVSNSNNIEVNDAQPNMFHP